MKTINIIGFISAYVLGMFFLSVMFQIETSIINFVAVSNVILLSLILYYKESLKEVLEDFELFKLNVSKMPCYNTDKKEDSDLLEGLKKAFPDTIFEEIKPESINKNSSFIDEYLNRPEIKELFSLAKNALRGEDSENVISDSKDKLIEDLELKLEGSRNDFNNVLDLLAVKDNTIKKLHSINNELSAENLLLKSKLTH